MKQLVRWLGPAVLAVAALALCARWQSLPQTWIVHWGSGGQPDGSVQRSIYSVFSPVAFGLVLWMFLDAFAQRIEHSIAVEELARALTIPVRLFASAVACILAVAALLPLLQIERGGILARIMAGIAFAFFAAALPLVARELRKLFPKKTTPAS